MSPAAAVLDDLAQEAQGYVEQARSPATLRAYDAAWRSFVSWCTAHHLGALPADPKTVGLYITSSAKTRRPATINKHLAAIRLRHEVSGHPPPTADLRVKSVLRGVRRKLGVAPLRQVAPLLVGDLICIVEAIDTGTLIGRCS